MSQCVFEFPLNTTIQWHNPTSQIYNPIIQVKLSMSNSRFHSPVANSIYMKSSLHLHQHINKQYYIWKEALPALSSNLSFTHFEIISNNEYLQEKWNDLDSNPAKLSLRIGGKKKELEDYHLEIIENVSELFNLKWVFEFGVTTVLLLLVLATTVTVIVEKWRVFVFGRQWSSMCEEKTMGILRTNEVTKSSTNQNGTQPCQFHRSRWIGDFRVSEENQTQPQPIFSATLIGQIGI